MLSWCQLCSVTRQVSEQSQESCIRMIEWKEFDFHRWLVLLVAGKVQEDGRAGTRTTSEVGDCVWSCVCGPVMCHWLCVVLWCVGDCVWSCDVSVIVCGPVMCHWLFVVLWCLSDCVWSYRIWNGLPLAVRQSPSLDSFKRNLKTYYFASQ